MSLYEKSTSGSKYKFHLEIEKGNFSVFDKYGIKDVMSQYRNANINILNSHTTLHSLLKYIEKSFTVKNEANAIEKWKELKIKYVNFNEPLTSYKERFLHPEFYNNLTAERQNTIKIEFNNFISLLNYRFGNKLKKLKTEVFNDALNESSLEKENPIYIIRTLREEPELLNLYLNKIKNDYSNQSIGNAVEFLDISCVPQDIYKHFLIKSLKEDVISHNQRAKLLNNLTGEDVLDIFEKVKFSFVAQDVLNNINIDKAKMVLNFLQEKNYNFAESHLRSYSSFIEKDPSSITKLTDLGVKYKGYFEDSIYRNSNNLMAENSLGKMLIKSGLWNFNEKSENDESFMEYYSRKYEASKDNKEEGYNIRSDYRITIKNLFNIMSEKEKIKDIEFLKNGNEHLAIFALNIILKSNRFDNEALQKYFNNSNISMGMIKFLYSQDSNKKADMIMSYEMNQNYFDVEKEDFKETINEIKNKLQYENTEVYGLNNILNCLMKANKNKEYFQDKEISNSIRELFLDTAIKIIKDKSYMDYEGVCNSCDLLINKSSYDWSNEDINKKFIELESSIKAQRMERTINNTTRMDELLEPLKIINNIKMERDELKKIISNKDIVKNIKRL